MPERIHHFVVTTEGALRVQLVSLPPGETAWIDASQYEQITGEPLDEFSEEGRLMLARIAAETGCTIRSEQGRVCFTKS